jgi:hypothetical protein
VSGADQTFSNGGNLAWCLPLAEHDLRKTLPRRSVMVDAREPKVFEGTLAQNLKEAIVRGLRCDLTTAYLVEKGPQLLPVHRGKCLEIVDFGPNSTVT